MSRSKVFHLAQPASQPASRTKCLIKLPFWKQVSKNALKICYANRGPALIDSCFNFAIKNSPFTQFNPQKIKSAIPDSLVHRLSILLANIYTSYSGRRGVAQFWATFSQKMRERVDKCLRIPGWVQSINYFLNAGKSERMFIWGWEWLWNSIKQ